MARGDRAGPRSAAARGVAAGQVRVHLQGLRADQTADTSAGGQQLRQTNQI